METAVNELGEYNRRTEQQDRRQNHKRAAFHSIYKGRRKSLRRVDDPSVAIYVDKHDPQVVMLALGIMMLCVCDAFFTLKLISHGSYELNPVLAVLIEIDVSLFLIIKFFITGSSVSFLVMHKYHRVFNRFSGYQLLAFCAVVYLALVIYELSMLRHLPLF